MPGTIYTFCSLPCLSCLLILTLFAVFLRCLAISSGLQYTFPSPIHCEGVIENPVPSGFERPWTPVSSPTVRLRRTAPHRENRIPRHFLHWTTTTSPSVAGLVRGLQTPGNMAGAPEAGATAKLTSYLSRLNPVPGFPEYTGPHKVGTVDVEIAVSELESPGPAPANAAGIHTVQFRIFYPARPDSTGKRISWLPAPQRNHVSAYTKFLGLTPILAEIVSYVLFRALGLFGC